MLAKRRISLLNKGNFENSKVSNCKRRRRVRNIKNISGTTSHGNGRSANLNLSHAETFSDDSHFQTEHLHEIKDNQLEFDASQSSEDVRWLRTVNMEKGVFGGASTCESAANVECWNSQTESDSREELRHTDTWRKLLFPQVNVGSLLKSEEIFKENVKALLDAMDSIEDKSSYWSRLNSCAYFDKIKSFMDDWSLQLLIEKKRLNQEVWLTKVKLKAKHNLVTNRLSILTGVFRDLMALVKFSGVEKQAIQIKTGEIDILNHGLIDYEGGNLSLQETSFENQVNKKDGELVESRKRLDECSEELTKMKNKLKATEGELSNLMLSNNRKLNKCRKLVVKYRKELSQTQNKLKADTELNNLKYINIQKAQLEQKEMQTELFEIQSMLVEVSSNPNNSNGHYFNTDLNKENMQILKDIKSLIQYEMQLVEDEDIENENMLETANGSGFLKVTENEMHLVTLIASFLKVSPFPVSTEFIYSYIGKIDNVVNLQYVDKILRKFPTFFKQVPIAPGSTKKNWCYLDLKPIITI